MKKFLDIRDYFSFKTNKKIYSFYEKNAVFGNSFFINDAYVLKRYDDIEIPEISLEKLNGVHEIIKDKKIGETLISLDLNERVKITRLVHGDLSYDDEPSIPQIRNVAKTLRKLHKNVSENDIAMDIISLFYHYKDASENKLNKIEENRMVRELKSILDKAPIGLCHNLLTKDNIIYRFDSSLLINFELANINYTYFDLASFILENLKEEESKEVFLKTYFGSKYNQLKHRRIDIFIRFLRGFYYYFYQYLYSLTNKDYYLELSNKYNKK